MSLQEFDRFSEDGDEQHDFLMTILDRLCRAKSLDTRGWCVSGMANLSWERGCQLRLVKAGAVEVCTSMSFYGKLLWLASRCAASDHASDARLVTDRCVGVSQVALTWRLAGNGKFVRRNLAVVLCNLSRHPDAFEQILEDGIVEVWPL